MKISENKGGRLFKGGGGSVYFRIKECMGISRLFSFRLLFGGFKYIKSTGECKDSAMFFE